MLLRAATDTVKLSVGDAASASKIEQPTRELHHDEGVAKYQCIGARLFAMAGSSAAIPYRHDFGYINITTTRRIL
jgi:hypothetical protein